MVSMTLFGFDVSLDDSAHRKRMLICKSAAVCALSQEVPKDKLDKLETAITLAVLHEYRADSGAYQGLL